MRWCLIAIAVLGIGCRGSSDGSVAAGALADAVVERARLEPVLVSDEENGWKAITAAAHPRAAVDESVLETSASLDYSNTRAATVLKDLAPFARQLDAARASADKPNWLIEPESKNSGDGNHTSAAKLLIKALAARGRARIVSGDSQEGVKDEIAARNLGAGILRARPSMSQALMAISCLSISNRVVGRLVSDKRVSTEAIRALLNGIPEPPLEDSAMQNSIREELSDEVLPNIEGLPDPVSHPEAVLSFSGVGTQVISLAKDMPNAFDRRDTVRAISEGCGVLIDNLSKRWGDQRTLTSYMDELVKDIPNSVLDGLHPPKTAEETAKAKAAIEKVPNPIGRILALLVLPTFDQFADNSFRWRTDQSAVRTMLAIRLWRDAHANQMPPSLDSLRTAGFLNEVPKDLYGEGNLHYDAKRQVLWSVGPNGTDEGGRDRPGIRVKVDDFVWSAVGA